jgi:hypothetical protein
VQVRVINRLSGSLANIDPDVVAVRRAGLFDVAPNCRNQSPNCGLFFSGKGEEISFVPPRNNQAVSVI